MRLAARRDVGDHAEAVLPCLADPGQVACHVLGAHQGTPQLLGRDVAGQAGPGGAGRRRRVSRVKLERGQHLGGVHDLRAYRLHEGQVEPPVVTAGERLAADERHRLPQAAAVPGRHAALGESAEIGPVEPRLRVQRVLPAAEVHDPFRAAGSRPELPAGPRDELAQRIARLRVIRVGAEQVAELRIGQADRPVQRERQDQLALRGKQRASSAVDGERAENPDPQLPGGGPRRFRRWAGVGERPGQRILVRSRPDVVQQPGQRVVIQPGADVVEQPGQRVVIQARPGLCGRPVRPAGRAHRRGPAGTVVRRKAGGHVAGLGGGLEQADDRLVVLLGQRLRPDLELQREDLRDDAARPVRVGGQLEAGGRGHTAGRGLAAGYQGGDAAGVAGDVGQEGQLRSRRRCPADQQGKGPVLVVWLGDPAVPDIRRAAVAEPALQRDGLGRQQVQGLIEVVAGLCPATGHLEFAVAADDQVIPARELAGGKLAGWYDLIICGYSELEVTGGRAKTCDNLDEALDLLAAKAVTLQRRLGDGGPTDVRYRRITEPDDEDWALSLLVSRATPTAAQLSFLTDIASDPGGIAALVAGSQATAGGVSAPASFQLSSDPDRPGGIVAQIFPLQLEVRPQALTEQDYESIVSLFETAAQPGDVAPGLPPYDGSSWPAAVSPPGWPDRPAAEPGPGLDDDALSGLLDDISPGLDDDALSGLLDDIGPGPDEDPLTGPLADTGPAPEAARTPAGELRIGILGSFTVNGAAGALLPAQSQLILALALNGPVGLSNPQLGYLLGADPDHLKPSDSLRQLIARTRRQLGPAPGGAEWIVHLGGGQYSLHPEARFDWTDFSTLAERGMAARDRGGLREAMALVRGQPFTGCYHWWRRLPAQQPGGRP